MHNHYIAPSLDCAGASVRVAALRRGGASVEQRRAAVAVTVWVIARLIVLHLDTGVEDADAHRLHPLEPGLVLLYHKWRHGAANNPRLTKLKYKHHPSKLLVLREYKYATRQY